MDKCCGAGPNFAGWCADCPDLMPVNRRFASGFCAPTVFAPEFTPREIGVIEVLAAQLRQLVKTCDSLSTEREDIEARIAVCERGILQVARDLAAAYDQENLA